MENFSFIRVSLYLPSVFLIIVFIKLTNSNFSAISGHLKDFKSTLLQ